MKFILHDKVNGIVEGLVEVAGAGSADTVLFALYGAFVPPDIAAIPAPGGIASLQDLVGKRVKVSTGEIIAAG
jgi:hypothetical protein